MPEALPPQLRILLHVESCSMRYLGQLGRSVAIALIALVGVTPASAQSVDPELQGRVFQTSDGGLWIYRDGLRYPLVLVDISEDQIDAIAPRLDQPVARVDDLFTGGAPSSASPAPAPAPLNAPFLDVANPHPNESVPASFNMSGMAYDPLAESGTGIDQILVFVEDRDAGGINVGAATLFDPVLVNGWSARVTLPLGPHTLFVYAHSAITGRETVISIPVRVV
ncbi:MAG: hypothetical protein NVSMB2_17340 [Chloroflexota bacterium]